MESFPFDLPRIAADLGIGGLEYQPEVASTNDWALRLSEDDARQWPLLVLTAEQTGGRGRGSNSWWSASGSLTFSLVVDAVGAGILEQRWPLIALATGLAVCDSLHKLYPPGVFGLKWPNDVYLSGRKLCGILVEAPSQARGRVVVGVGINVNNSFAHATNELRKQATSLADAAGGSFDLSETLIAVVRRIIEHLHPLNCANNSLAAGFRRYCMLTGRTVRIEAGRETVTGQCLGIADDGALLLHAADGERRIHSGCVAHWE